MEDDTEVEDVVIEFEGNFDLDGVTDKQIQVIGIDTSEPILNIDSKFYKIDVENSIGTRLLFKHDEGDGKLRYYAKTDKVIKAHRVMIKPKR